MNNNIFKKINNLKKAIQDIIMNNNELLQLIDCKKGEIDGNSLLDRKIYFTPQVFSEICVSESAYLMFNFIISNVRNNLADVTIGVYCITSNTQYVVEETDELRIMAILSKVYEIFMDNQDRWNGIGRMELQRVSDITTPMGFEGSLTTFEISDFK